MTRTAHASRTLRLLAASTLLVAAGLGCKKAATPPKFDPEANSGPDAKRSGATPMEVNKQYTDNVDFDKQDRTDWKAVELRGKPGDLEVLLHWDNALTDLNVDVFDSIGVQIASSPPNSGESVKRLVVNIAEVGTFFLRIQAPKAASVSDYTIEAKWGGEVQEAPPPAIEEPKVEKKKPVVSKTPSPPKKKKGTPDAGLQGRIVQSVKEGGGLTIYLDKGSSAGVTEGTNGWILEGPSGANPIGEFTITQVVGDSKSIAKTSLKSLNKNTRVSINVK